MLASSWRMLCLPNIIKSLRSLSKDSLSSCNVASGKVKMVQTDASEAAISAILRAKKSQRVLLLLDKCRRCSQSFRGWVSSGEQHNVATSLATLFAFSTGFLQESLLLSAACLMQHRLTFALLPCTLFASAMLVFPTVATLVAHSSRSYIQSVLVHSTAVRCQQCCHHIHCNDPSFYCPMFQGP